MKTWETILGYEELTGSYRSIPSLQNFFFTESFYRNPRTVMTDQVSLIEVSATNTPGPLNTKGGSAKIIQPKGGAKRVHSLFRYFTELPIDPTALQQLRAFDSPDLQAQGQDVLDLQLEEANIKHRIAREVIFSNLMTWNRVNLDADGNILTPTVNATSGAITDASGTVISADAGVPNSHRGNLGGIISAQWSTAGTDIALQLDNLDRQAAIDGAPKVMDIFVNALHKSDLIANTKFNDMAKYANVNNLMTQALNNFDNDIVQVFGKRWHFISGTWVDSNGTTRDIMPENYALMLPDAGPWLRAYRGRTLIPTAVGVASAATPMSDATNVEGEFAYAYTQHNPVRTSVFTGDCFGLAFANPNAVWVGKCFS